MEALPDVLHHVGTVKGDADLEALDDTIFATDDVVVPPREWVQDRSNS